MTRVENINGTLIDNKKDFILVNSKLIATDLKYKHKIVWRNATLFLMLHLIGLWGTYFLFTGAIQFKTSVWIFIFMILSNQGLTMGAHRLYAHRSFKAKPALQAVLLICHTIAGQNSLFIWCRDHRLHHRYTDTDGDPHNSKRGFFFSHIGWLMCKKHPLVIQLGRKIDVSDLQSNWMVMFQKKYFLTLYVIFAFGIPVFVPYYYFGESLKVSLLTCYFFRYAFTLNATWLVNSAAHIYGTRPYDKKLQPVESWFVSFLTQGEGWHNYHHAFPWDYKAAELPMFLNNTAILIMMFEKMGLAYDLKTASKTMVKNRIIKTGDGTHYELGNDEMKSSVTAIGPLHPLNPSYNVTYSPPNSVSNKSAGLPMFRETDILNNNVTRRNIDVA